MTASTKIQWRVQVRKSRAHAWKNKGLFETRKDARYSAYVWRTIEPVDKKCEIEGWGFGNTRVVCYIKGEK